MNNPDKDLLERNLYFFAEFFPDLHQRLCDFDPQAELEFDADGDPDIIFQGTSFYKQGARKHAKKQLEKFEREPGRITMSSVTEETTDKDSKPLVINMLARAKDAGITFETGHTTASSYHTVSFGFGLGQHIEGLVERTKCRNLIIFEPNLEFLYQSLFVYDWRAFGDKCHAESRWFHLLTDRNPDTLLNNLRIIYRQFGPVSFDGLTIYEHYTNPIFEPLKKFFREDADLLFTGLGYFEDELHMIGNTYGILSSGDQLVFNWSSENPGMPVFVIGSGPSLDMASKYILENQHKAIIVSCGTSLGACLRIGIQPDFHVELERGQAQINLPRELQEKFNYNLDDIWMIGSSTLMPEVGDIFKKKAYFFRQPLSCYPVFSGLPNQCIRYPSPSVSNAGLSFAQDVGFREFYFFGVDLGFKDPDNHHSSATSYYQKWTEPHDRTFSGNFGGTILSNHFYSWIRDGFKGAIMAHSYGFKYYNCSDGAAMDEVIPMLPECISLPEPSKNKKQVVEDIASNFTLYSREIFDNHWRDGAIISVAQALAGNLIRCVEDHPDLYDKRYVQEIMMIIDPMTNNNGAKMVFRGTLMQAVLAAEYYLDRVSQDDHREALAEIVCDEMTSLIQRLADTMEEEFTILAKTGRLGDRYEAGLV